MKRRLFIIGNGLDLAHGLPTKFNPDFKDIATQYETYNFWEIYQSQEVDIWTDFENLLACPDFNCLEEIFYAYTPDYLSDRERDRNGIIYQLKLNGNLQDALEVFANQAESALDKVSAQIQFRNMFNKQDLFVSFNYTHTLERVYNIEPENVLHIHGEVGGNKLLLGYMEGAFSPEKYSIDLRAKGVGPYSEVDIYKYIDEIEDCYVRTAYSDLLKKTKSFSKKVQLSSIRKFLKVHNSKINQIVVYGHSCAVDFSYFDYLNKHYPDARWEFYVRGDLNSKQGYNVKLLIEKHSIKNYTIKNI